MRGYQPMLAVWAETGLVLADQFRDGNVPAIMEKRCQGETVSPFSFQGKSGGIPAWVAGEPMSAAGEENDATGKGPDTVPPVTDIQGRLIESPTCDSQNRVLTSRCAYGAHSWSLT